MRELKNYFDGEFQEITEGKKHTTKSPADTSKTLWETHFSSEHAKRCIDSAQKGFQALKRLSLKERCQFLLNYKEEVLKRKEDIAMALAQEVGKPLWEARTEAGALASKVDVTIGSSLPRIEDTRIENIIPKINGHTIHKPIGPSAVIGPFNFPCHLANGQILSLLISGNSVIFKPSEKTLLSTSIMMECFHAAGFPKGAINLIIGDGSIAQEIITSSKIRGVFFTGSKNVGIKILEATYKDLGKMVALELGGKNSSIIHKDADLDHCVAEIINACFLTSGQRCTSTGNIIVHKSILNEFREKFLHTVKRIQVDHPIDYQNEPFMSSLIDHASLQKFQSYVSEIESKGASTHLGFAVPELKYNGYYAMPSVHEVEKFNLDQHQFIGEEVFAPHACIFNYEDIEQAIEMSNFTEYGLSGSVFTADEKIYQKCLNSIDVGIFNLNRSTVGASSKLPFGGVKSSGNFRPAALTTIDACVHKLASLETFQNTSSVENLKGLSND